MPSWTKILEPAEHASGLEPRAETNFQRQTLSRIPIDAVCSPLDSLIQICIIEDDVRTLSAELEGNTFKVTLCGSDCDFTSNCEATCEGDLVDVFVMTQSISDSGTVSDHDVDDARWETGLLD